MALGGELHCITINPTSAYDAKAGSPPALSSLRVAKI
jgi:hypothetical protein